MLNKDNNSVIRRKLKSKHGVKFTCGIKSVDGGEQVFTTYCSELKYRDRTEYSYSIREDKLFGQGMNVTKFGPTCVTLYTFDMFNRRISGKIKYSDIKFVTMEQFECENPFSTENCNV